MWKSRPKLKQRLEVTVQIRRIIIFLLLGCAFFAAIALVPSLDIRAIAVFLLGGVIFFVLAAASYFDRRFRG